MGSVETVGRNHVHDGVAAARSGKVDVKATVLAVSSPKTAGDLCLFLARRAANPGMA